MVASRVQRRSACTMAATISANVSVGAQPRISRALLASPRCSAASPVRANAGSRSTRDSQSKMPAAEKAAALGHLDRAAALRYRAAAFLF